MFYWQLNEVNGYKANCFAFVEVRIDFMALVSRPGWVHISEKLKMKNEKLF